MSRIRATYRIETAYPLDEAAAAMAGEQSSGTFVDVPGETDVLRERHGARVERISDGATVERPTLPGATSPADSGEGTDYQRATVELSFPLVNIGKSLPNLLTMVAGNLFELRYFSGIRLLDLDIPAEIVEAYPGPQFGIDGTRELVDIFDRPIIGTIIKPNVGLEPAETAELVETLVDSGLDFIKDDELIADPPYSPVEDRIEAVMDVIHRHEDRTGKTVMYACNITDDVDRMLEHHDVVKEAGGNCIMVSMNSVGLTGFTKLRRHSDLPIHAHRNGWGALSRCPQLGFSYVAYQKFWRLAGADHMHVNGIRNKFCESDESVIRSAQTCQTPIVDKRDTVLPVFSSGQWAGQAPDTYEELDNADLMYLAGGGIIGHPDGPAAGVKHLKQAWNAVTDGISLEEYARDHEELRRGIEKFGPARKWTPMSDLLLTFYGDDLTGSTDVLESLSLHGVSTVLFLHPPDSADVAQFSDVQAVGVAGTSRNMTPPEMDDELPPIFESLGELDSQLFQYKICSTFDSSPEVGSIGRAIDLGQSQFDSPFVPIVVSAPSLRPRGRYVLFGNLFATAHGETYRLDRHPTMSEHPATPMAEADLRIHLGEQTNREIGLLDIRRIDKLSDEKLDEALTEVTDDSEIVFFDGLNHEHQRKLGRLIWNRCSAHNGTDPLFTVSSSGLNYALAKHWTSAGIIAEQSEPNAPASAVDQLFVMSGSASPINREQIEWALNHGFDGIRLKTERLVDPDRADVAREEAVEMALKVLSNGGSPLLYSARGPDDPSIERTKEYHRSLNTASNRIGEILGNQQGQITRAVLEAAELDRICIAGGDTSGSVVSHLDVFALEFISSVGPGSPLCRATSRDPEFDGLEVALKGGQVQTVHDEADYFGTVRDGGAQL